MEVYTEIEKKNIVSLLPKMYACMNVAVYTRAFFAPFMFQFEQNEMEFGSCKKDDQIKALRSNDKTSAYRDANNESLTNIPIVRLILNTMSAMLMHIFGVFKMHDNPKGSTETDESLNESPETERMRQLPITVPRFFFAFCSFTILIKLFGSLLCHF